MRFGPVDHPMTGVAVPVPALRSRLSCGVGEYPDLAALGAWAAGLGLEVIQLLPVNDTGSNSSPYSALSAFVRPNFPTIIPRLTHGSKMNPSAPAPAMSSTNGE